MKQLRLFIIPALLMVLTSTAVSHAQAAPRWIEADQEYNARIHLYFFWSKKCPHCLEALSELSQMERDYPWLSLHSLELTEYPDNVKQYLQMAETFEIQARSVPAFFYCGKYSIGYQSVETTGIHLRNNILQCYKQVSDNPTTTPSLKRNNDKPDIIELPLLGRLETQQLSLPILTVIIAALDAFNPCAFFVLLFLLSMMVHARSKIRLLIIGSVFVFFSGLMYFLFMSAWLNVFLLMGELKLMTLLAGVLATIIALINIKDFFLFKQGISLSISDTARRRLLERIRQLLSMDSLTTVILASIVLAITANTYELLCTAGLPMLYTRILTLRELGETQYYLYLLFYNVIYVIPLLMIVILFTMKLGTRKLNEKEGRILKLLSGTMMFQLGILLIISPQSLNNILIAIAILLSSITISALLVKYFYSDKPGQ